MLNWYIAKSKPRKEAILINNLRRWGVESFYPSIRNPQAKSAANRKEPLFPSYVFCLLDPDLPTWQAIRWAPGLSYFLSIEGQPFSIPESLIEYFRDRVHEWNQGSFQRTLMPGDKVTIIRGPFEGMEAIFRSYIPARQRCQVLLQGMNQIAAVELPWIDVEDVAPTWSRSPALA